MTTQCGCGPATLLLVVVFLLVPPDVLWAREGETLDRVDLFELAYTYDACHIEHTGIRNHHPRGKRFDGDRVFALIDDPEAWVSDVKSWIETVPDKPFSAEFRLNEILEVAKLRLVTDRRRGSDRYEPVAWKVEKIHRNGRPASLVADGLVTEPGAQEIVLAAPVDLEWFRLTASPATDAGQPRRRGDFSVRLRDFSIFTRRKIAMLRIAPAPRVLFDKQFGPFVATCGQRFSMRAWKVWSTGKSFEESTRIRWTSSDPSVATVRGAGRVTARRPGRAVIEGRLGSTIRDTAEIVVLGPEEGEVDLDLIEIERWIRKKGGRLVQRPWDLVEGLPRPGEDLVYRARLINAGMRAAPSFTASWRVDGEPRGRMECGTLRPAGPLVRTDETANGEIPLLAHENEMTFSFLEMPFDGERHTVELRVEPDGVEDANWGNNTLKVFSDAIVFGYYMSDITYFALSAVQREGWRGFPEGHDIPCSRFEWGREEWGIESSTAYDRFQRIVRVFNRELAMSRHPLTPHGITERINGVMYIVPELEDHNKQAGYTTGRFGRFNKTVDLIWDYAFDRKHSRAELRHDRLIALFRKGRHPYVDLPLLHEISHARYLIDLYGSGLTGREVEIRDVDGTRVFPDDGKQLYNVKKRMDRTPSGRAMMMGNYGNGWCEHSACAWERVRGMRARGGSWNAPRTLGEYLNVVPDSNVIRIVTPDGSPAARARIVGYKSAHARDGGSYEKVVDGKADFKVVTDRTGRAELGPNPFGDPAEVNRWRPKGITGSNGEIVLVLRITYRERVFTRFLTVMDSNLGYWAKYGLQRKNDPILGGRRDTELTYTFTIDPAQDAAAERRTRDEVPEVE